MADSEYYREYYKKHKDRINKLKRFNRMKKNLEKKVFVYNGRYFLKKRDLAKYTGYSYTYFIDKYKKNLPINNMYIQTISMMEYCKIKGIK